MLDGALSYVEYDVTFTSCLVLILFLTEKCLFYTKFIKFIKAGLQRDIINIHVSITMLQKHSRKVRYPSGVCSKIKLSDYRMSYISKMVDQDSQ